MPKGLGPIFALLLSMFVTSFVEQDMSLHPIEVEVSLVPGLPLIQFLGLPDTAIKESVARIRSAIFHQGFELPASQQILVNLRPNHLKKSSRGLDLAVAAAILWETKQLLPPQQVPLSLYGELSLTGEIIVPSDIEELANLTSNFTIITGQNKKPLGFDSFEVNSLRHLEKPKLKKSSGNVLSTIRPALKDWRFSSEQAQWLQVIAHGEHPSLITGPAGCGKTTMANTLHSLLRPPTDRQIPFIQKLIRQSSSRFAKSCWRPLVQPHHSATTRSMLGGGYPIKYGDLSRSHHGLLILDELLEFRPKVLDSLREPIESGVINLSRSYGAQKLPADFLLVATSNLCPCGQFLPNHSDSDRCRCRNARREKYLEKLTGPILDRFSVLTFLKPPNKSSQKDYVTSRQMLNSLQESDQFVQKTRKQSFPNQKLSMKYFETNEDSFLIENLLPDSRSFRRKLSLLRVARTIADLDQSLKIKPKHIAPANELTILPFLKLHDL